MNSSSKDSEKDDAALKERSAEHQFELPVESGYREQAPEGSWEAGYRLSLEALKMVKDRPEIFKKRDQRMCGVEFIL